MRPAPEKAHRAMADVRIHIAEFSGYCENLRTALPCERG